MAHSSEYPTRRKVLLNQVIDERAKENPEMVYAEYPISSTGYEKGFRKITYAAFANAINGLAWWLHDTIGPSQSFDTLAYIGTLDIRYNALLFGAIKAGYKVLFTSPRNSIPAHTNLFKLLNCNILVTPNPRPQAVAAIADSCNVRILEIPTVEELLTNKYPNYPYNKTFEEARRDPLIVLHTSGTTGLPKPIIWPQEFAGSWLQWLRVEEQPGYVNTHSLWCPGRLFFMFPPFHAASMFGSVLGTILGETTVIFPPSGVIPSAQVMADGLKYTKADCAAIAPLMAEEIFKKPDLLDFLSQNLPSMFYSGGNVGQEVGDTISKKMKFFSMMGTTETGLFPMVYPAERWPAEDWNYLRFPLAAGVSLQKVSDDEYEAVVVRHTDPDREQSVFKVFPERDEYRTGDLYTPHPTKPGLWGYRGRGDDIIVFLTGEKTNPISMEETISRHPKVRSVLVMGTLRFQAALLVELVTDEELSTIQKAEIIEDLWPIIQEANKECPHHAQIKKSHILFTSPQKPMQRAGKGTIQRKPTLQLYETEIDNLYADADKTTTLHVNGPVVEIRDFKALSSLISDTLVEITGSNGFTNDENFFLSGMDSLQALQFTRSLKTSLAVPDFEISTVYANPSITSLANAVIGLSTRDDTSKELVRDNRIQTMEATLTKYKAILDNTFGSENIKSRTDPFPADINDQVILLTGSTGAIGSYILQVLLETPGISHIYCLNRGRDSHSLQLKRNKARGLPNSFPSGRVTFLTTSLWDEFLGLEPVVYSRIQSSVTGIIHNAWPVNFNLSLSTFEPHLKGIVNLLRLSASAKYACTMLFISSITSISAYPIKPIPETIITDPLAALPMGYGESKYISERLLDYAGSISSRANILIARVGQVTGPAYAPGFWNKSEWFPSMIISSRYLGMLPDSLGKGEDIIDWVPIDCLANTLVDFILMKKGDLHTDGAIVLHPCNPRPTTWNVLKAVIANALSQGHFVEGQPHNITTVPLVNWIERVREEASKTDTTLDLERMVEVNPAIKLLSTFEGLMLEGMPVVDGKMAAESSNKLRSLKGLEPEWMERWIKDWI
ncbi:hypothetical protein F5884DRAFT_904184 [Xylogone sp. PMI_703]|nr:hypothetical protein F5884DRAFT_904184 [Xylogone sp. PMI_703]